MALNSLLIDPRRKIHGVWRWFDEAMLNCCDPIELIKLKGISLAKLHCLARCQGANSVLKFASDFTEESLRADVLSVVRGGCSCEDGNNTNSDSDNNYDDSSGSRCVMIACYDRSVLGQTGSGHFSPIGGYHASRDLVLILDVARFKYPPHWVQLSALYEAMQSVDKDTHKSRGYLLVARPGEQDRTSSAVEKMRSASMNKNKENKEVNCCGDEDKSIRECGSSSSPFVHECSMCATYTSHKAAAVNIAKNENDGDYDKGRNKNDHIVVDADHVSDGFSDTDNSIDSKSSGSSSGDSVSSSFIATIDSIQEWLQRIYQKRLKDNTTIRKYLRSISIGIGVSTAAFILFSIERPRSKVLTLEEINDLRIPNGW